MDFFFTLLAPPLGIIMRACYALVQNVGVAIILFTVIVRILMFPISVKQQKNQSKSQIFAPRVREIQAKHRGNTQKIQEEMAKLQKQGYNPVGGCLPMVATMLILFGVLGVVYAPMTYFERIDRDEIAIVMEIAHEVDDSEPRTPIQRELWAMGIYRNNPDSFRGEVTIEDEDGDERTVSLSAETLERLDSLKDNLRLFGIDFSQVPWPISWPMVLVPLLSFIFAAGQTVIMQRIQKITSPESIEQMGMMKYMMYFMPVISLVIAFQFPAGAGFYWAISALIGIGQSVIIFKLWPPEKLKEEVKAKLEKQGHKIDDVVVVEKHDGQKVEKKKSEMSSKEEKEYYRKKLEEARKADLEKYGEVGAPPEEEAKEPEQTKPEQKKEEETHGES